MRAVQTKQTGVVWSGESNQKVSIVSGRAVIDAFGRNITAYYPMTESYGNIGTYNHATGDLQAKRSMMHTTVPRVLRLLTEV